MVDKENREEKNGKKEDLQPQEHYIGHRNRLREKFLKSEDNLNDYELLELLLSYAIPRKDLKPLAKDLIRNCNSYDEVFSSSVFDLMDIPGIKESSATLIKIVNETVTRILKAKIMKKSVITKGSEVLDFCRAKIGRKKEECVLLLWLNTQLEVIEEEIHQEGTIDNTTVYLNEIVRRAMQLRASHLVMAHNHPTGKLKPSKDDIGITKDLKQLLAVANTQLYDHLIISKEGYYSFKDNRLI